MCDCADDAERREALNRLPPDLPESYRRLLERVNRCSPRVQTIVKMCLHFIAFAAPRLTIIQLRQAVSVPEPIGSRLDSSNTVTEQEILRRCSSLIRKSEDEDHLEFSHFSVQEFLESESLLQMPGLEIYSLSESGGKTMLASQCLRFLLLKNFDRQGGEEEKKDYSEEDDDSEEDEEEVVSVLQRDDFYGYSAVRWLQLTKDGLDDPSVLGLAKCLFNPSKTPNFSKWALRLVRHIRMSHSTQVLDDKFRPLHLAAVLNIPEICEILLTDGSSVLFDYRSASPLDLAILSIFGVFQEFNGRYESADELFDQMEMLLPTATRRNRTIDFLKDRGAKLTNRTIYPDSEFMFSMACVVGLRAGDLKSVIGLLIQGVVPTHDELEHLREFMEYCNCDSADAVLELLRHLNSLPAYYSSSWGIELGSIAWNWAIANNLSFTNDPTLTDSRISLTDEALLARSLSAIEHDDVPVLKQCLADGRINISAGHLSIEDTGTLLHKATSWGASRAVQVLLEAGCDFNVPDSEGALPLHKLGTDEPDSKECECSAIIKLFHDSGFSLLTPNQVGQTVWHTCLESHNLSTVFERLHKLAPDATAEALLMKANDGRTPLLTAFEVDDSSIERDVLCILEYCKEIPGFWYAHEPVLTAAAQLGSEDVICRLVELGAKQGPTQANSSTPLHHLSLRASSRCVELLKSAHLGACEERWNGRLPVEAYIARYLHTIIGSQQDVMPAITGLRQDVMEAMISPAVLQSRGSNDETLWEFCCGEVSRSLNNNYSGLNFDGKQHLDDFFAFFLNVGAMRAYEDIKLESGILPLISCSLQYEVRRVIGGPRLTVFSDTLRKTIVSTRYWTQVRKSSEAIQFLKTAIRNLNTERVGILLENDLDIHQRVDGHSAIEYICQPYMGKYLTSYEPGKQIVVKLLAHSNPKRLNDLTFPEHEGRGLLQEITSSIVHSPGLQWLIKQLLQAGVKIEGPLHGQNLITPLFQCLDDTDFVSAGTLLEMGADPNTSSPFIWDAAQRAALMGGTKFLKQLLASSRVGSVLINWERTVDVQHLSGRSVTFAGVNNLHMAVMGGHTDCVEFFVEEGLLNVNTVAIDGYTAVHIAATIGQADMIHFLHSKGASMTPETSLGATPLHMAVRNKHLTTASTLVRLGALNSFDAFGMTPTMYAKSLGHAEMVRCLHEAFGSGDPEQSTSTPPIPLVTNTRERFKAPMMALEKAVILGDIVECKRLVDFATGLLNRKLPGCHGCSPLILAISNGWLHMAQYFLGKGASTLNVACDRHGGRSALEFAAAEPGSNTILPQVLAKSLEEGCDWISGDTFPLHQCVGNKNMEGLELILQHLAANKVRIGYVVTELPIMYQHLHRTLD